MSSAVDPHASHAEPNGATAAGYVPGTDLPAGPAFAALLLGVVLTVAMLWALLAPGLHRTPAPASQPAPAEEAATPG